jgi:hypothetical protein
MMVSDWIKRRFNSENYVFIQYIIIYVPTPFGNQVCYMCTTTDITSEFVWTYSDISEESVWEQTAENNIWRR